MKSATERPSLMRIEDFAPFVHGLDHPEGVTTGPDGTVYAGGEAGQVYRIDLNGASEQIATTGGFVLGLCLDGDGAIYACDLDLSAVMRIDPDGTVSTYSSGAPGRRMSVPNYPVFDAAGNLYVSDSGGWKENGGCLFRIRPGGETAVVGEGLEAFPNGMALHPDGSRLYVVLSNVAGVVSLRLGDDDALGPPQTVIELPRHVPDGLAFDVAGNLYIACYTPDVIYRLSPEGNLSVLAEDWESVTFATPTNIAFAGPERRTLVVASLSRWHLTKGEMPIAGARLQYPTSDLRPPTSERKNGVTDRNRRFADKVIVITGAGSGIGRTAALAFAREGGSVVIGDINESDGAETARQILDSGGYATAVRCDVREPEDVQALIGRAVADFGGVDVLYNNAGVVRYGTVEELSVDDWDFQLDINLKGTFLTCKYAVPQMRRRGGGAIVNTASVQAFASQKTVPAYAASKGGVVSLTTTIALDHADDNIRCNCIAPGTIRTPMVDQAADTFGPDDPEATIAEWGRLHPLGRVGKPEEVANLVLFLASDEAAFCTGGCYRVDGGLLSPLFNG